MTEARPGRRFLPTAVCAGLLLAAAAAVDPLGTAAEPLTRVFINGVSAPVFFNDGDSFTVKGGPFLGTKSRLAGFNTLESYGPVHWWGDWHPYELYIVAKMATLNARRGVWHCTTEGERDGYGRLLLDCPDLAVDQIRKGLAHAMNVDDVPQRPEYLRAQQEAIRERRGMWAHGVPDFIVTSLHSYGEDPERDTSYNRLVSTRDGHSEKWEHTNSYPECSWQCAVVQVADQRLVHDVALRLREDPALVPAIGELSNLLLVEIVDRYARLGELPEWVSDGQRALLEPRLAAARRAGALGQPHEERQSCALYVDFTRRYGRERPSCLRGHGERP